MKVSILTFLIFLFAFLARGDNEHLLPYLDQEEEESRWDEKNISHQKWFNFRLWKKDAQKREKKDWRQKRNDKVHNEGIGKVLAIRGEAFSFRGLGHTKIREGHKVREGDVIETSKNAHLWIFLASGDLLRMMPNSSLTVREMNITEDHFFFFFRPDYGFFYFQKRPSYSIRDDDLVPLINETDLLFSKKDRATFSFSRLSSDKIWYELFEKDIRDKHHREVLRTYQSAYENNQWCCKRKTKVFWSFAQGDYFVEDQTFWSFISSLSPSYIFQLRGDKENETESSGQLFSRGHLKRDFNKIENSILYKISERGKKFEKAPDEDWDTFWPVTVLFKRPLSIYRKREELFDSYFYDHHSDETSSFFWKRKVGVRRWKKEDLDKHIIFLKKYTQRVETTNLNQLNRKLLDIDSVLDDLYYRKPFIIYLKELLNYR